MMSHGARTDLAEIISGFRGLHVWVVGDVMLDEYVSGKVDRISPEAPIPVVQVRAEETRLGGATNVARQIATLGARVSLCGVVGEDTAGRALIARCAEKGIDTRAVAQTPDHRTTRKLRVLGHGQQLLRLDWEENRPCPTATAAELIARLRAGDPPDVVVLSDYAKGFLTDEIVSAFIAEAAKYSVPVLVDPKRRDLGAYRGATVITPNLRELEHATGLDLADAEPEAIAAGAHKVVRENDLDAIVVTMGDRGMLVVPHDGPHSLIASQKREVYDITGAGDTAIAVLALSLALGTSLVDAAHIANTAAGIAVGEVGAAAVAAEEIIASLARQQTGKIFTRARLAEQVEAWHLHGRSVVFTNGCFDLLHLGHVSLLREASKHGDVLVLAINSDASVRRLKGKARPLVPEADRAALLAALDCVDAVVIFDEDTPLETIAAVRPDVLVKGQDYKPHEVVGRELVESYGGRLELVPLLPEHSTSALVDRILKSRKETA
jgi:D-beta-D-heptose 7-phosphate kinase/D-beta-D-heptose 1-phosphate adenosyltransferase